MDTTLMRAMSMEPVYFTVPAHLSFGQKRQLWKSKPTAPTAPDPIATAEAQGKANIDAARVTNTMNRSDQETPYGTLKWVQDPNNPDKWTSRIELDPRVQQSVDASLETSLGLEGAVQGALGRVQSTFGDPNAQLTSLDFNGLPRASSAEQELLTAKKGFGAAFDRYRGQMTDPSENIQMQNALASRAGSAADKTLDRLNRTYESDFNLNSAPAMPLADENTRKAVEQALYSRAQARLDPRFQSDEAAMISRLANQGITQGSEAYAKEMESFGRTKNDAYSSALNDATGMSTSEMAKIFQMGLAGRQQGVSEAQLLREMPAKEAAAAAALTQGYSGGLGNMLGVQSNQLQTAGNLAAQDLASTSAAAGASFNMNAAERANGIQEQTLQQQQQIALRNQIMNELNALRTGAQTAMPTFTPTNSVANVGASPVAQSIYNSYQGQQQQYQTDVGSRNAMIGGLASLAGSGMQAMALSDRRLKTNIQHLRTMANGLKVYSFTYLWNSVPVIGVMAQEVLKVVPQAVHQLGAFYAVDYSKLGDLQNG